MKIDNSKGKIYYGMHFYPGVAEYSELGSEPYRVFLNEDTIRAMDPTFAGRPVFVEHVDNVDQSVDDLRKTADGWVVESFFNSADGKHWVKFIVVSEIGERAIESGFRLSNAYVPKSFAKGAQWNGVSYAKEIVSAEYEHLAIVPNPRYEESVIMTPEEFKRYNDDKVVELKRLANSKEKKMGLKLFKRTKVENSLDFEGTMIELPKSKKEMSLVDLVTEMDAIHNMNGYANGDHMVKVGEDEMSVNDLVKKHMDMCNDMASEEEKKNAGEGEPGEDLENDVDQAGSVSGGLSDVGDRGGDKSLENEEDEEEKDKEKKKNALAKSKEEARKKAAALKNAGPRTAQTAGPVLDLGADKVARGIKRYGSDN